MARQWAVIGVTVAGLGLGAFALVKFAPDVGRVEVGAKAPDYRVYDLGSADSISLREHYRGKVTLVNIWATWCVPCRVEMPAMQHLFDSLSGRGFQIAAVSVPPGSSEEIRAFGKEFGLTFDLLQDKSGDIQQVYQTTGVPESFLLNRDGIIMKRVIGAHDWNSEVNRALVRRLLDEAGP